MTRYSVSRFLCGLPEHSSGAGSSRRSEKSFLHRQWSSLGITSIEAPVRLPIPSGCVNERARRSLAALLTPHPTRLPVPDTRGVIEWLRTVGSRHPQQARSAASPVKRVRTWRPILGSESSRSLRLFRAAAPPQRHYFLMGNHDFGCAAFLGLLPGPVLPGKDTDYSPRRQEQPLWTGDGDEARPLRPPLCCAGRTDVPPVATRADASPPPMQAMHLQGRRWGACRECEPQHDKCSCVFHSCRRVPWPDAWLAPARPLRRAPAVNPAPAGPPVSQSVPVVWGPAWRPGRSAAGDAPGTRGVHPGTGAPHALRGCGRSGRRGVESLSSHAGA